MLIQAAYELGIDRSQELAQVVLANKDKFLLDILYQKEVVDNASVSDAEVHDFWNHLEYKIRASHIVVSDSDTAQALLERLTSGESFEKIAFEYSIDPSARKNKGDLGYFTWGALVDEVQQVAFKMEPGELSPSVKSNLGYHLIKLVDKLPNEQRREFESMKVDLRQQIIQRKQYMRQREFFDEMSEKYPVTIDTTTCAYLLHKRSEMYPPMLLETLPRNDFDVLDSYDSLTLVISAIKRTDVLVIEARRRGLDSDPQVIRKLRLFKEYTMADLMRSDSTPKPEPPDDGVTRMYYDKHPQEFTNPATYHVYEILLGDELKALDLKKKIKSEAKFRETALELSERPGKRALEGDLGYITRTKYPEIYDLARKTSVGTIGGPVVTRGKYSIFWVADKTESELKDYLGVKRDIFRKLSERNEQQAFAAWIEQRGQETSIEIYEDALWSTINMDKYPDEEESGS
jgi:parvulin-like peptidyl-prolyl isomerase